MNSNHVDCHSNSSPECTTTTTLSPSRCYKRRLPTSNATAICSLESLSTPSLAETDDGCSSLSTTRDESSSSYLPTRLVPKLPLLDNTPRSKTARSKKTNRRQEKETFEWWNRLQRLAVVRGDRQQQQIMEEQPQQLDSSRVLEESSIKAGLAEQNAYSMKQALEDEWHLSNSKKTQCNVTTVEEKEESFKEEEDTADNDSDSDDRSDYNFLDALEVMTVTSSVCSLVAAHDDNVETTAREALEESNLQATTAEKTAREMQQAIEWLGKQQQQNDNVSNSTRLSNEEAGAAKNANIMPSTTSPPDHANNCSQSATWSAPPSQYEAPMDDTNIETNEDEFFWHEATTTIPFQEDTQVMEAHLVAQEQTCAVQVLCYETDLMAQAVAELVLQENNQTVSTPPTTSIMPSSANARSSSSLGKSDLKVTRRQNRNSSYLNCSEKTKRRILFVTPQRSSVLISLVVLAAAAATLFAAIRRGGNSQDVGSAGHDPFAAETTVCLYHDLNADSWLPNDGDKQPQCPWHRVDIPNGYDTKTIQ